VTDTCGQKTELLFLSESNNLLHEFATIQRNIMHFIKNIPSLKVTKT